MRATASFRPRVRAGFGATVVMAALLVGVLLSASAAVGSGDGVVADAVNLEKLFAADGASGDYFGYAVSIDEDTCVIGARWDDDDGPDSGSAYVFTREGDTWSEQAKLTASDGASGDYFGYSVSIDGDTCVIGAHGDDDEGLNSGSAYVFTREGDTWNEQAKLTASDGAAHDCFGFSVSVDADSCLVGADGDDDRGTSSGSAYVFTREGDTWSEQTKLVASDGASGDYFGYSVSIDGDTCVIGAHGDDDHGASSGSAYAFTRKKGAWS
ncbi:MAG: FG-GAP repeat protein, partial [Coriobacteriia bacterium]|nr:FG-GAP repeat protein [Coriobacteriia bacterium]